MRDIVGALVVAGSIAPQTLTACEACSWKDLSSRTDERRVEWIRVAEVVRTNGWAGWSPPPSETSLSAGTSKGGTIVNDTDLLAYANALRSLGPQELKAEYRRVHERFLQTSDHQDRLRLVVLLLEPDAPFKNLEKARALLEDYLAHPMSYAGPSGYRDVALFLFRLSDSLKQANAVQSSVSRELALERSRRERLVQRVENLQAELQRIRDERGKLEEQVKALKEIEETLRARMQSGDERLK